MQKFAVFVALLALATLSFAFNKPDPLNTDDDRTFLGKVLAPHSFVVATLRNKQHADSLFWFYFTTKGLPRWRTSYLTKQSDSVAKFTHRFGIVGFFEYDGDIDGAFNKSNVVRGAGGNINFFDLAGRGNPLTDTCDRPTKACWTKMTATDPTPSANYYTISTSFTGYSGGPYAQTTVTLDSFIAPSQTAINANSTAGPNKIKFGMTLQNFPFLQSGSYLGALGVIWSSSSRVCWDANATDANPGCDIAGGGHVGWQRWVQTKSDLSDQGWAEVKLAKFNASWSDHSWLAEAAADLSGDTTDSSIQESFTLVAFFFDDNTHPTTVSWDPDVGLSDSLDTSAAAVRLSSPLSAVCVVFFALLARFMRA